MTTSGCSSCGRWPHCGIACVTRLLANSSQTFGACPVMSLWGADFYAVGKMFDMRCPVLLYNDNADAVRIIKYSKAVREVLAEFGQRPSIFQSGPATLPRLLEFRGSERILLVGLGLLAHFKSAPHAGMLMLPVGKIHLMLDGRLLLRCTLMRMLGDGIHHPCLVGIGAALRRAAPRCS